MYETEHSKLCPIQPSSKAQVLSHGAVLSYGGDLGRHSVSVHEVGMSIFPANEVLIG